MIFCDIFLKFEYLPTFVPLIQLLVGSVFMANFIANKNGLLSETIQLGQIQAEGWDDSMGYRLAKEPVFSNDFRLLQTRTMFILALYGCFVLFYCSMFRCCYRPSPFGMTVLSSLVLVFQLYSIIILGKNRPNKKHIQIFIIISIVLFFLLIVLFQDKFVLSEKCNYIVTISTNICVLLNMIIWGGLYIKKEILLKRVPKLINNLKLDIQIASLPGIESRLQYIIGILNPENSNILCQKAIDTLKRDDLYFTKSMAGQVFDNNLIERIKDIINSSKFKSADKTKIIAAINEHPQVNSPQSFISIQQERETIFRESSKRLIELGFIEKVSK